MEWQGAISTNPRAAGGVVEALFSGGGPSSCQGSEWVSGTGEMVQRDVIDIMEESKRGNCEVVRLNRAYLVLLPKFQGAVSMGDFRPILLSNSIYLVIAKLLANRLGEVIGELVGPFRIAFIPCRQLVDVIVFASEILEAWKRRTGVYVYVKLC